MAGGGRVDPGHVLTVGFDVRVQGGASLAAVRRQLRTVGDKGLGKQLSAGLSRAAKPLLAEVRTEATRVMPSGYAPVLSKSLRSRLNSRAGRASGLVTVRIYGDGEKEQRDVVRLNQGELRHPVFGRSRTIRRGPRAGTRVPSPWAVQRIRPGFVDRPADRMIPDVVKEMQAVVDQVAAQITKG